MKWKGQKSYKNLIGVDLSPSFNGSIAQLVESTTDNRVVTGSSPVASIPLYEEIFGKLAQR